MTLRDDDVFLDAGTYQLGARAQAAEAIRKAKTGSFSLHHIIPYCYPMFLGYLIERATALGGVDAWTRESLNTLRTRLLFAAEGQQSVPSKYGWLCANLFEGPSGNFRLDDPRDNPDDQREQVRPQGFDRDLWAQVHALGAALQQVGSRTAGPDGYNIRVDTPLRVAGFKSILRVALALAARNKQLFYPFHHSDWVILEPDETEQSWYATLTGLNMGHEVTDDMKLKFRELMIRKPSKVLSYSLPHDALDRPMRAVSRFWRLRRDNEVLNVAFGGVPRT